MSLKIRGFVTLLLCLALVTGAPSAGVFGVRADPAILITLDEKIIDTQGNDPYLDGAQRTMVPVRFIAEALGADVEWDNITGTATFTMGETVVTAVAGNRNLTVNDKITVMDTEVVVRDDRTYAPIRYIAEAFGISVDWDEVNRIVVLSTKPARNNISAKPPATSAYDYYPEHKTAIDFGAFTNLAAFGGETANDDGSHIYAYMWNKDNDGNARTFDEFNDKLLKPYVQALKDDGVDKVTVTDDGFYICEGNGVSIVIMWDIVVEGIVAVDVADIPADGVYRTSPAAAAPVPAATARPARTSAPKPTKAPTPKPTPVTTPAPVADDLAPLIASGSISARITGNSIDYTTIVLTNNASYVITVTIPVGTYFGSNSGSVQNMAVREPKTTTISPGGSATLSMKTACMNISRDIPGSGDSFTAQTIGDPRLERVIALCYERNASYAVTQAAVWIVTDQPSDYALLNTLVYDNGGSAISSGDLATAKEIVAAAG